MAISSASFYKHSGFYTADVWQALVMPALTAAVDQEDKGVQQLAGMKKNCHWWFYGTSWTTSNAWPDLATQGTKCS